MPAATSAAVRRDGQRLRARRAWHPRPRVGLLSIGEEATKGNGLTRESHRLLKSSLPSFIGNVEARDVYRGQADVIVCDGFTGNIALKISEGLVEVLEGLLRRKLTVITDYSGKRRTRRSWASTASPSSVTADRARTPCARASSWRTASRPITSSSACRATSRRSRCLTGDRLHLSRTGRAESRHGPRAGRCLRDLPRRRSTRPMPRSAIR